MNYSRKSRKQNATLHILYERECFFRMSKNSELAYTNSTELASTFGITPQYANKLLRDLMSIGWVYRHEDDGNGCIKRFRYYLTPQAMQALDEDYAPIASYSYRIEKGLI